MNQSGKRLRASAICKWRIATPRAPEEGMEFLIDRYVANNATFGAYHIAFGRSHNSFAPATAFTISVLIIVVACL